MQGGMMDVNCFVDKELSSPHNPLIKEVMRLKERRQRDRTNRFLIEGYREVSRAISSSHPIEELLICPELFLGSQEAALICAASAAAAYIVRCTPSIFAKISYRDRPDGILAIAPQQHRFLSDLLPLLRGKKEPPFLLVAEAIEKPGNLGTILRSADAAGVDALILCDRCTDLHNPNVVRASVGTLFTVPVIEATSSQLLAWCQENKISIFAATPAAEQLYTDVSLIAPLLIAVGTEQLGLSSIWLKNADIAVKIPMCGVADSLNVATATTLLLYEVMRQRRRH